MFGRFADADDDFPSAIRPVPFACGRAFIPVFTGDLPVDDVASLS
jgi:hypothetical protein